MPKVDVKEVREKVSRMNDAWFEGAKTVEFNGIAQAEFQTEIEAAAAKDAVVADLRADLNMKINERDDAYFALDQNRSKVGQGVAGNPSYGNEARCMEPWASSARAKELRA